MSRPLPWVRLDRDFDQDPAIQAMAERHPTSLVLAVYCITLASAARCDGVFTECEHSAKCTCASGAGAEGFGESTAARV